MLLKILIEHEFSDPAKFAMFATGYAELCRSYGVTPTSGTTAAAPVSAVVSQPISSPAVAPATESPASVEAASLPASPLGDANPPKRRGRPPSSAKAEEPAAPIASEPAKESAPTETAPAASPAPAATSEPAAPTVADVKAALNRLIMTSDQGEADATRIRGELFLGKKLADLDSDTLAKIYDKLIDATPDAE